MKSNFKIYLISGKAHSGKSTVANIIKELEEEKNNKFIITQYSKYLKMYAHEIIDWNYEENSKPRKFLQDIGYFIRFDLKMNDLFIKRMLNDIKIYENYANGVIISDIRFKEEIEVIKKNFYNVTSINIKSNISQTTLTDAEKKHISENDLNDYNNFDYEIINNTSKESLKQKIKSIIEVSD